MWLKRYDELGQPLHYHPVLDLKLTRKQQKTPQITREKIHEATTMDCPSEARLGLEPSFEDGKGEDIPEQ